MRFLEHGERRTARMLDLAAYPPHRFPNTDMVRDPRTKHFCENGDTFNGWIGPDVHFLFSTIKNGKDCCWVLTHKVSVPILQVMTIA